MQFLELVLGIPGIIPIESTALHTDYENTNPFRPNLLTGYEKRARKASFHTSQVQLKWQ